ncbi:MAG: apolipoprotein D and lipocalin family protein [Candidatus Azotimanducaceae bacterium]|jgi:apolipoprotein D and lipocalin family protein
MGILKMLLLSCLLSIIGCQSASKLPPLRTAESVDLSRFAGNWHVIANIPTFIEKAAYNAIESYSKPTNGKIATTFSFNEGSFNGEIKTYHPTAFVQKNSGNAIWGMQFIWPIKAEYRIVYIDPDYEFTIIGRTKRDYVWLMARRPIIADTDYQRLLGIIEEEGYDLAKIRRIPQKPAL